MKPLMIDLFAGLGGWAEGGLAEGYDPVGFDIEEHIYGEHRYPAQLVVQDVLTLHGSQFREAALIVASPPCQKYSYMAMPWSRAKELARWYRDPEHPERLVELNALFNACFRIQREASEAAGRHIPMVVENVKGAQKWIGEARANYGSFYLWGDVPIPQTGLFGNEPRQPLLRGRHVMKTGVTHHSNGATNFHGYKTEGMNWSDQTKRGQDFTRIAGSQAIKNQGGSWFNIGSPGQKVVNQNPVYQAIKIGGGANVPGIGWTGFADTGASWRNREQAGTKNGNDWFGSGDDCSLQRRSGSKSTARKAASAMIAKIPLLLARHIAKVFHS